MSFFALGSSAAVALGATAGGVIATGAGVAAAYGGSKLLNKATSGSSTGSTGSLPNNALDIDKVITDARTAAADNYKNSLGLEATNNPGQAGFRNAATTAATNFSASGPFQSSFTPGYTGPAVASSYSGTPQSNSLLNESADSILQQLRLGSALPADVQAQITRTALAHGGQAGLSGSFAGRGLVARDIGTTSLALLSQRQQAAQQAGGLLDQLGLAHANYGLDAAKFGLAKDQFGLAGSQFGLQQYLANAGVGAQYKSLADAYQLPNSGLDPGAIASLYVGNNNALNQTNQNQFLIDQQNANNRNANLNKLLGFGSQILKLGSGNSGGTGDMSASLGLGGNEPFYSSTGQ